MKPPAHISASSLATTLVVSTLMLLAVGGVFMMWDNNNALTAGSHHRAQQLYNLESALTLYCHDSTLIQRVSEDSTVQIYPDDNSLVKISVTPHGLYEIVNVCSESGRYSKRVITGAQNAWIKDAVLYLADHKRHLSVVGRTTIKGSVYLPQNGVAYNQINSVFFSGEQIPKGSIRISDSNLPEIDPQVSARVREILSQPLEEWLIITDDAILEDTIIAARSIEIADNFSGSVQLFATGTVIIGSGVKLKSPSGIYLTGDNPNRLVQIFDNTQIFGYVVVEECLEKQERPRANYIQSPSARVHGMLYIAGTAQVQGMISGVLFADQCSFFATEGIYAGTINAALIVANPSLTYPILFTESRYTRRIIKTKKVKGSTLTEVIISTVIMLITLLLAITILTNISTTQQNGTEFLKAETELKRVIRNSGSRQSESLQYEWGEIDLTSQPMTNGLQLITATATITKRGKTITYKKII